MAHAKQRTNGRFSAIYNLPGGGKRSAGTFDDQETAERIAQEQERFVLRGTRGVSPEEKATTTLDEYFPAWLKRHPVELSTKAGYRDVYRTYIKPSFGTVRVAELQREAIRGVLSALRDRKLSPGTQKYVRSVLSGMMSTAVEDGYRPDNPAAGIRIQRKNRGSRKVKVFTVDQFKALLSAFPSDGAVVLARVIISTGCRPSEAFVLTPGDFDFEDRTIHFDKALQKIDKEDSENGLETYIVAGTKTHEERTLKVDAGLLKLVRRWIDTHGLQDGDLLFPRDTTFPRRRATSVRKEAIILNEELIATLGTHTAPNGKEYRHGVYNCYITAKCKCVYCRQAFADYRYALERRKGRSGHAYGTKERCEWVSPPFVTSAMWRKRFKEACRDSGLPFMPTAYQLRHTHASWLIRKGEDPKTVMARLGHTGLSTTAIYVEVIDDGQSSADIMDDLGLDDEDVA